MGIACLQEDEPMNEGTYSQACHAQKLQHIIAEAESDLDLDQTEFERYEACMRRYANSQNYELTINCLWRCE